MVRILGGFQFGRFRAALSTMGMVVVLVSLTGCAGGLGQAVLTQEQVRSNVESFDVITKTISETHWDQSLVGDKWESARQEFRPQVERARTSKKARAAMRKMIATLGQTHFSVIPARIYDDSSSDGSHKGDEGDAQMDIRFIDDKAVVVSVVPDSPAAIAGVHPGWVIKSTDGDKIDVSSMKGRGDPEASNYATMLMMRRVRFTMNKLSGDIGDTVEVVFRDDHNRNVTKVLELREKRGHRTKFGNLPAMHNWLESRLVDGDVRYVRFNHFMDPMKIMPAFGEAVAASWNDKGMIIDLRGNGGGIGAMAMGMAGWFVEEENVKLGTMHMKNSQLKFVLNPRPRIFRGPLAILVDGMSASTSEILAGGLQDLGRARIFGSRTTGAALPSVIKKLPNGDRFQYAIANYISEGGKVLEGDGVTPDVEVALTRDTLLEGHDNVIDAAVAWIHSQASTVK